MHKEDRSFESHHVHRCPSIFLPKNKWRPKKKSSCSANIHFSALKQVKTPKKRSSPVFPLGFWLVRICPNDKFIEIFAQRFHYFEDPINKFFALNLLFQDASYSLALKSSSFLFKFFSFAFFNTSFWYKISKICPKISHFSQISHSRGNTGHHVRRPLLALKLSKIFCGRTIFGHFLASSDKFFWSRRRTYANPTLQPFLFLNQLQLILPKKIRLKKMLKIRPPLIKLTEAKVTST